MLLQWLQFNIDITTLLWLFPIVFMFHDFEEILTIEGWIKKHGHAVQSVIPKRLQKFYASSFRMNTLQFAKDVFWIFLTIVGATILAVIFSFHFFFLMLLSLFFFHVFTHLGQMIMLKIYTPGVITSVALVLPYSLYTYFRLWTEGIIFLEDIVWSAISMAVILPFLLLLLIKVRDRETTKSTSP